MAAVLTVLYWAFVIGAAFVCFPIALVIWAVTRPFDSRLVVLHRFTCVWASLYTWFNPAWPVTVVGRERIRKNVPYVIVANHASVVDIFVVHRLHRHYKWVSKVENFKLPLIGWNMTLNRYIPLRRGDRESVLQMLELCRQRLREGNPIVMFPEGTRSMDGQLKPFKPGAFQLALELGLPVLPLAIDGTARALPKKGIAIRGRHPVTLTVLPEVDPATYGDVTAEALAARVRQLIGEHLGQLPAVAS